MPRFCRPKTDTIEIEKPNILIVEGRDEELFFDSLIKHLELDNIQILDIGGKTIFRDRLNALITSPRFSEVSTLGIVRDANSNPSAAYQSICNALQSVKLSIPERPLIMAGSNPRVVVLILPKEDEPGMLEDLCLKSVESDPALTCTEQYFQCLQIQNIPLPHNTSKAKTQVFLASRHEAGKRLGEAAQAGYWSWDSNAFEQVRNFLRQMIS